MLIYLHKEFKTFRVKIDSKTLSGIGTAGYKFQELNYVDISKEISDGIKMLKNPPVLFYLF
jgi:hypothetical protein